ncbi:hypothetical protein ARMGADRAFT_1067204 [Armillaria gallica]|uniref:F-box domain-containing protein n=1 Tax=Armillaria gallica TaxID=47427 RepID=A0A2H3CPB7_ARMGA|nr:hypothetical protein ARMGADRAFT_1067204 [Armillaria gallica]
MSGYWLGGDQYFKPVPWAHARPKFTSLVGYGSSVFEGGAYGNAPGTSKPLYDTCFRAGFKSSHIDNGLSHPDFPFKRIRLLAINGSSIRGDIECGSILLIRRALARFPYIQDLILSVPLVDPHENDILPSLSLSFLTSLTLWVDYACQGRMKYYLSNISLPCLRFFALKYVNNIVQYPFAAKYMADVLGTCSQSLRSFSLEKVPIRTSSLIDILSVVPSLTCLEIRDPVLGSFIPYCPVSQTLATYFEANPVFLPDLEAVQFIWQREDTGRELEKR